MHITSDHRVAGSSPAGCKSSPRVDLQPILHLKIQPFLLICADIPTALQNLYRELARAEELVESPGLD
jgi:hypothetical protein